MLNGLCWDDDHTIAQWLEHRWLQARVPGSSPGGESQFFFRLFPFVSLPETSEYVIIREVLQNENVYELSLYVTK